MAVRPIRPANQQIVAGIAPLVGFEGASETFGVGAILLLDSNQLDEGIATTITRIMGVSARAATGTTGSDMPYYPAVPSVVFEGSFSTGGANPPTAFTLVATNFGEQYGLNIDTSQTPNVWYIDQADEANVAVTIIGFRDAVGTSDARVFFTFVSNTTEFATDNG